MGYVRLFLVNTLFALILSQQTLSSVNSMLDPDRLTWWRTKWCPAPILLSINNRSKASTAVFYFCPSTTVTNGVFEVTFPDGFSVSAANVIGANVIVNGQIVQVKGQTWNAGQDSSLSISGLTNPAAAGAYGPFALRTRFSPEGQQVDVNLAFGTVYICGDVGTLGSLSVSFAGVTVSNVINAGGNTLSFKFTLGVSLWRFDTFLIYIDPRWTVASGAICSSYDYSGKVNNLNGTNSASPHSLRCITDVKTPLASQTVYIYGLAVESIDIASPDNRYVDLRITPVTNPSAVVSGFVWTVATYRFGTNTNLERGTYTAGPVVTYDAITTAAWIPTWGMAASDMLTGSSYFMDLSFTVKNQIPAGGEISIAVTEDVETGDANWFAQNCYIVTFISKYACCSVKSATITVAWLPIIPSGTTIKLRNIVKITSVAGSHAQIDYIKTYNSVISAGVLIDVGTNLASFTVPTLGSVVTSFGLDYDFSNVPAATSTYANLSGGSGDFTQSIEFWIIGNPNADISTISTIVINCPFSQGIDDFSLGLPSYRVSYADNPTNGKIAIASMNLTLTSLPPLTYSPSALTPGSLTFQGSFASITSGIHILLYQTNEATSFITLPRVGVNPATAYECRVSITTAGKMTQRGAARFIVTPQKLANSSLTLPCTDAVNGVPAIISFTPMVFALRANTADRTYYVEVEVPSTTGAASGLNPTVVNTVYGEDSLSFGVDYPHSTSISTATAAKLYAYLARNYVAITGLPEIPPSSPSGLKLYLPIGLLSSTAPLYTPVINCYFTLTADPRYFFITHYMPMASISLSNTYTSFNTASVVGGTGQAVNGDVYTAGMTLDLSTTSAVISEHYFYFVFPAGFAWSPAGKSVKNLSGGGVTYPNVWFFSSPFKVFQYPGVLVNSQISSVTVPLGTASIATGTISIFGFTLPLGSGPQSIRAVTGKSLGNAPCLSSATIPFTSLPGAITNLSVSPTSVKSRGPDGVGLKHVLNFLLQHGVTTGGSINLSFALDWSATVYTTCSVSGLAPAVLTVPVVCSVSGNSVTVSRFADFSTTGERSISLEITNLLAPSSASTTLSFVTSLSTSTGSAIIDSLTVFTGSQVTITASSVPGVPTWLRIQTYPMTSSATNVDLYLSFRLPHSIPIGGVLTITSPMPLKYPSSGSVKNFCFLSPVKYSDCALNGSVLQISLLEAYQSGVTLELFLDTAVDNPKSPTTSGFAVVSQWGGVTIDSDTTSSQMSQIFIPKESVKGLIVGGNVDFAPKNAGETASYTFTFKDSVDYVAGEQYWILFPPQYDYFLGDAWPIFSQQSTTYYLPCSSTQLGVTTCSIDHSLLSITGSTSVSNNSDISIIVENVGNPGLGKTGSFEMFHVDGGGSVVAINQSFGSLVVGNYAKILDIRSVGVSDQRLFQSADYRWVLNATDTVSSDSQLKVKMPPEFDFSMSSTGNYNCSILLSNSVSTYQSAWNTTTVCNSSAEFLTLPSPLSQVSISSTDVVTWTVQSISNPQFGLPRSSLSINLDFDITDSVLWPLNPFWVSKFSIFLYQPSTQSYSSRSYSNMHAAYTSYSRGRRQLIVNGYNPQTTTGRITVYAGTQSDDLSLSTEIGSVPMAAKQVVFKPSTNPHTHDFGTIKYISRYDNWTMKQGQNSVKFRVAASSNARNGLYYIDWAIVETKDVGQTDFLYAPPASTLLEILPKRTGIYQFSIGMIPSVTIGSTSAPIKISISNPPFSDVAVAISILQTGAGLSVAPQILNFGPETIAKFVTITVMNRYDTSLGYSQGLGFSLTGADAFAYNITRSVNVTINPMSFVKAPGRILNWGIAGNGQTSVFLSPTTDQIGVIYYQLAAIGAIPPNFLTLKSVIGAFQMNTTVIDSASDREILSNETWFDFQRRVYKLHINKSWIGSIYMPSTKAIEKTGINWLFAGTKYQIAGYLDNSSPSVTPPVIYLETFTTDNIDDCQPISVKFQGMVAQSFGSILSRLIANTIGVTPLRLVNQQYLTSTTRALQTTTPAGNTTSTPTDSVIALSTFSYTLLPNRFSTGPSPFELTLINGTALASFAKGLKSAGIVSNVDSVVQGTVPKRVVPQWKKPPMVSGSTKTSVSIGLQSNTDGLVCCIAVISSMKSVPTSEQIMLGVNSASYSVSANCTATNLTASFDTVNIGNLHEATEYAVYCAAGDLYPLWPTLMDSAVTSQCVSVMTVTVVAKIFEDEVGCFSGLSLMLVVILS